MAMGRQMIRRKSGLLAGGRENSQRRQAYRTTTERGEIGSRIKIISLGNIDCFQVRTLWQVPMKVQATSDKRAGRIAEPMRLATNGRSRPVWFRRVVTLIAIDE